MQEHDIMLKIPKERLIICYLQNCQLRYAQNKTTHVNHPSKVVPNFPTWLPLTLGYARTPCPFKGSNNDRMGIPRHLSSSSLLQSLLTRLDYQPWLQR